jgi:nucleotide-binding universal stress UspA family protein
MFEKILVPLDGSKLGAKILPTVVELAKTHNSQVTLIHACHTADLGVGQVDSRIMEQIPAAEKKVCEAFLSQAGKDLENQGIKVDWVCVEGVPPREIIGYAQKNKMDLICMATHGRSEVGWALGSTAARVVAHATVPVLLVRVMAFKPTPEWVEKASTSSHFDEEHWVP